MLSPAALNEGRRWNAPLAQLAEQVTLKRAAHEAFEGSAAEDATELAQRLNAFATIKSSRATSNNLGHSILPGEIPSVSR